MSDKTSSKGATALKIIGVLCALAFGGMLWAIPYWGFLANGFANVMPVIGLSFLGAIVAIFTFGFATEAIEDTAAGPVLAISVVGSAIFWFALLFTNTHTSTQDTIIWQTEDGPVAEHVTSDRVYPFWNNDFIEVVNTQKTVSYEMDQRCGDYICSVRASVTYSVNADFVAANAGTIDDYQPLVRQALTEAIVRDAAFDSLEDLESAVCFNFLDNSGLDALNDCPLDLRVSLNVSQSR